MCHFAFPPWSWTGNIFILAIISLSLGWVEECKPFSYKTFLHLQAKRSCIDDFLFLHQRLTIKFVIQGTLGKLQDSKIHYKKCRNVIKSRAPGWKWIHSSTGKAKWGRSEEASCSPQLRAWPPWVGAAFMLITQKCQVGQGKVPNSDHPVSERRVCLTFLCGEYSSTVLKGKQQEVSLCLKPRKM